MFGIFWIFFKIVGLAPWKTNKRGAFRYNWWSLMLGYGLMIGAIAHYAYSNSNQEREKVRKSWLNSATAQVVGHIDFGTTCITSFLCLVAVTTQTRNIFRIVEQFQELKLQHNIPGNPLRFRHAILLGLLMTSTVTFDLTVRGLATCEPLIAAWYMRFFLYGSEVIFTSAMLTLYDLFQNANDKLRTSVHPKTTDTRQVLPFVDFIKGYGHIGNRGPLTRSPEALRELSAIHWKLCTIGSEINSAFNGQLLSLFIALIVRVVTTPYFVFLLITSPYDFGTATIVANVGWVIIHSLQLCLLVWPCSLATAEAGETSTIIVHQLNKPLPADSRNQMEMLLVQLTNHKLNFTVYEMFTIDLTVMTSVAGAVTTYLVILIQFQNAQAQTN